jgi:hypothetical protein
MKKAKKVIYGTIEEETKLCRKAMKGVKKGDLVFFCHHGRPIEELTEPVRNRIKYILEHKGEEEQALRLHWFRPIETAIIPKAMMEDINSYGYISSGYNWKHSRAIKALVKKYLPGCPWDSERESILPNY